MEADFDLDNDGNVTQLPPTRKPYRPGEGRPAGYSPKKAQEVADKLAAGAEDPDEDPESDQGRLTTSVKLSMAKARKEVALAGLNELDLKVKSGQYLPRAAFREASATLLAALSQGLRSMPDTLERKFGLQPEVLEFIEGVVDESLATVADGLALFTETKT
ncbi:DUF1441 family protein [Comamonas antarctica]|uniref:DUF1441 family protein n=1 Tax=Comamonas antarctica TaxID=2743470 RepID=UPI0028ECA873|nr:DUF1441 family protein [Comamonas antarctica]